MAKIYEIELRKYVNFILGVAVWQGKWYYI